MLSQQKAMATMLLPPVAHVLGNYAGRLEAALNMRSAQLAVVLSLMSSGAVKGVLEAFVLENEASILGPR